MTEKNNNWAEFNQALHESILSNLDKAFPEMHFQRYHGGWRSHCHLDGSASRSGRKDATIIKDGHIGAYGNAEQEGVYIIDLFIRQNPTITNMMEAKKALADIYGLTMPQGEEPQWLKDYKRKQEAAATIHEKMKAALFNPEGAEALAYLMNQRGYDEEFIRWAEFGYLTPKLADELNGFANSFNCGLLPYGVGRTHVLMIPYRNNGNVVGFIFRRLTGGNPKYLTFFLSKKASQKHHLMGLLPFNPEGSAYEREMVVVEGQLDALHATYKGIPNVVSMSGSELYAEALNEAKAKGVTRVKLIFDTNPEEKDLHAKIKRAINLIAKEGMTPFVVTLPTDGGKVDVDEYLNHHSPESLKYFIKDAEEGVFWLYNELVEEAVKWQGNDATIAPSYFAEFKKQFINLIKQTDIVKPTHLDRLFAEFERTWGKAISKESIAEEAEAERAAAEASRQNLETKTLLNHAMKLANDNAKGNGAVEALNYVMDKATSILDISNDSEFSHLLRTPNEDELWSGLKNKGMGIPTPFVFSNGHAEERLVLPSGAMTYICAATSHGKSRMLQNLALQAAEDGTEGEVLYFTFEEGLDDVRVEFFNLFLNRHLNHLRESNNNLRLLKRYLRNGKTDYMSRDTIAYLQQKKKEFGNLMKSGRLRVYEEKYTPTKLLQAVRHLCRELTNVRAVFIDYIQLLTSFDYTKSSKEQLTQICNGLMNLAKNQNIPIVAASQLNRQPLSPIEMAVQNIADASVIEHSANVVMLLWNSSVKPLSDGSAKSKYFDSKGNLCSEAQELAKRGFNIGREGKLYAILAKNRGGMRNIWSVFDFDGQTGAIIDPSFNPDEWDGEFKKPEGQAAIPEPESYQEDREVF